MEIRVRRLVRCGYIIAAILALAACPPVDAGGKINGCKVRYQDGLWNTDGLSYNIGCQRRMSMGSPALSVQRSGTGVVDGGYMVVCILLSPNKLPDVPNLALS
jgi:hypothetical protein